jgi:hypothetical protein
MKAIMVVTDSEAVSSLERAFVGRSGGFTVIPEVIGKGRTGFKTGDRVHPGGSSLLLTVVPEQELAETVSLIKTARDEAGVGRETRIWTFAVEEVA